MEVLGLAHIYDNPLGVIISVNSGGMWKQCYFFSDCQLLHVFGDLFFDSFAVQTSLDDGSVRAEEDNVRNSDNAVDFRRDTLGIYNLIPVHAISLGSVNAFLRRPLPDSHAKNVEILSVMLVVNLLDVRNFVFAWTAP